MDKNLRRKIKIEFGNLNPNFKTNFYIAGNERFVEGKTLIAFAKFYEDGKLADKYVNVVYEFGYTNITMIINLDYFDNYNIIYI